MTLSNTDTNSEIDMAILDFSKAFNTVSHEKVLGEHYDIQGSILDWISICLKSREQYVVVGGEKSEPMKVDLGVPQGTLLGSLIFLLYINNLPDIVTSVIHLFADDCLVYREIGTREDQIDLQTDLDVLVE